MLKVNFVEMLSANFMGKCTECRESMRKYAESWEILLKLKKYPESCESMRKCAKWWEIMFKV